MSKLLNVICSLRNIVTKKFEPIWTLYVYPINWTEHVNGSVEVEWFYSSNCSENVHFICKRQKKKRFYSWIFFLKFWVFQEKYGIFFQKSQYFGFLSLLLQKASTPSIFMLGQHCKAKCIRKRSSTHFSQFRSCFHWKRVWMKKIEARVFFTSSLWFAHTFIKLIFTKLESNISS